MAKRDYTNWDRKGLIKEIEQLGKNFNQAKRL